MLFLTFPMAFHPRKFGRKAMVLIHPEIQKKQAGSWFQPQKSARQV